MFKLDESKCPFANSHKLVGRFLCPSNFLRTFRLIGSNIWILGLLATKARFLSDNSITQVIVSNSDGNDVHLGKIELFFIIILFLVNALKYKCFFCVENVGTFEKFNVFLWKNFLAFFVILFSISSKSALFWFCCSSKL